MVTPRPLEPSSLFGLVSFRPRTAIVLAVLTLTVAIVALRFFRGSELRRMDELVREGTRLFASALQDGAPGAARDPAEVEAKVRELTGARLLLPRDDKLFSFKGVERAKVGKNPAAAIRLTYEGDVFLLLVVREETLGPGARPQELFSESGFISGEKEGKSFVFWEREGATFFLVSAVDLTRTFDLVRRYFS